MPTHALLIPDLPNAGQLLPWLERIDAQRQYSNNGPLVRELEAGLDAWISLTSARAVHAVSLSNGTVALELGIAAMDLPAGSRIAVPSLTFPATAHAVQRCGHHPVLCDVDEDHWLLTPEIARGVDCDAALPVSTYGMVQPADAWDAFTADTGRPVLLDAASALGWQAVGARTCVTFSLHATKPFGCGEGGLFVTADPDAAARVRRLANFGYTDRLSLETGTNAKMSEYAAAVALAQLARRAHLTDARRRIRDAYLAQLVRLPRVQLQAGVNAVPPSVLCVRLDCEAAPVAARLAERGIETRAWYCPPLHRHPAFAQCERAGSLAISDRLGGTLIGLPFHHHLSDAAIREIVDALADCLPSPGPEAP
jgi:dTDP-4-amino-4,6-dideoxygalactose transaminase